MKTKNTLHQKRGKQKGVALILTILTSMIMLSVVALVSRETVAEAKNSARLSNSMIAYYLAEAGLEDTLLQYRFNRDLELSDKVVPIDTDACKDITTGSSTTPTTGTAITNCGLTPSDRKYSVTMTSKKAGLTDQLVSKDDVYEIRLQPTDNVIISWTNNTAPAISPPSKMLVEISTFSYNALTGDVALIDKKLIDPATPSYTTGSSSLTRLVRIKPWYVQDDGKGGFTDGATLSTPPQIKLSITGDFTSSIASITSTGYYGGVIRQIKADLDKSSGSIINVLDFTIYSGSKLYK